MPKEGIKQQVTNLCMSSSSWCPRMGKHGKNTLFKKNLKWGADSAPVVLFLGLGWSFQHWLLD